ncbi:MAG: hypothetical protein ACR2H0_01500 [Candidatus Limnocylindrales bacterium]
MSKRIRFFSLAIALVALAATAGIAAAALSSVNAKGQTAIRVVRENTSTASHTTGSTVYTDILGATVSMPVASTTKGSLLVARFQGHVSIIQNPGCMVRILVGNTTMEPSGNHAFAGQANVSESVATSGAIERSLAVMGGTYTVKAQLRISQASNVNSKCIMGAYHFAVERHAR